MAGKPAERLAVSQKEEKQLRQIIRQPTNPQWLVKRASIIVRAGAGQSNSQIARELAITRQTVRDWRQRREGERDRRARVDQVGKDKEQRRVIEETLGDAPRSGTPPTFSAEQVVQIIAVSCEEPAASGRAVSHWTPGELADEVIRRGIVESISPRQVGRFLKRGRLETASEPLLVE